MSSRNISNRFFHIIFIGVLFTFLDGWIGTGSILVHAQTTSKAKDSAEKALLGRWKSPEAKIEFKPGKKISINGDLFDFAVVGSTIIVSQGDESMEFPYKLTGDTLTVWVEGRKVVYARITGDENEEEMPEARTTPTRGGGGNPQDLVGKWCYQANVQASGGGRQSDICFTLEANGTYSYYGESSSSNVYGGTASQSSDNGRWSATATTLTARSNSGETKTYSLERRNHPKTGDPMLIVDGDAFVTYYQKRPW